MEEEDLYERIRTAVNTPPEGIEDLVESNLSFDPYPCVRCGEIVKCGLRAAVDHFDKCKKNKIII